MWMSSNVPGFYSEKYQEQTVLESFLTQFGLEIAKMNEKVIRILREQLTAKRKPEDYETTIYEYLTEFSEKMRSVVTEVSTFSALAGPEPLKALDVLLKFCPVVVGAEKAPSDVSETILSFFPGFANSASDMAVVVGFVSECVFSILAVSVFERVQSIQEVIISRILTRFLDRKVLPDRHSFGFSVLNLILRTYRPLLFQMCRISFSVVSLHFNRHFPTKKSSPSSTVLFMLAYQGIAFSPEDYPAISKAVEEIPKLISAFKSEEDVVNSIFVFLSGLLPNMKGCPCKDFLQQIDKKAEDYVMSDACWDSSLQMYGMLHYLNFPPLTNKKFSKLIERKVFPRLVKPRKGGVALDYLTSIFRPTEEMSLNTSSELTKFVPVVYSRVLELDESKMDGITREKLSILLEDLAALNLADFYSQWLPMLLGPSSRLVAVTFQSLNRILNPVSSFRSLASSVPTNSTVKLSSHIQKLINTVDEYVDRTFSRDMTELISNGVNFASAHEVLEQIHVPAGRKPMEDTPLPLNVLYFLLSAADYELISRIPQRVSDQISRAEFSVKEVLHHWDNVVDLSSEHQDAKSTSRMPFAQSWPQPDIGTICLISVIPLALSFKERGSKEVTVYITALIKLILHSRPEITAMAAVVYEIICMCFVDYSTLCIEELGKACVDFGRCGAAGLHSLVLTYKNCLESVFNCLKSPDVVWVSEYIAFLALISPYPETRYVGLKICEIVSVVPQLNFPTVRFGLTLQEFLRDHAATIEQNLISGVVMSYSSRSSKVVPIYKLPSIRLQTVMLSPYLVLWRYGLIEVVKDMLKSEIVGFMLVLRRYLLDCAPFLRDPAGLEKWMNSTPERERDMLVTALGILFASATNFLTHATKAEQLQWKGQTEEIHKMIMALIKDLCYLEFAAHRSLFRFCLMNVHVIWIPNVLSAIMDLMSLSQISNNQKDRLVEILSGIMRRFASTDEFSNHIGRLVSSGLVNRITRALDVQLQLFIRRDGYALYDHVLRIVEQLTDHLMFSSQYFKYLHQTRLENPHGPIPRCSFSQVSDNAEISPVCSRSELFKLLFDWSKIGRDELPPPFTDRDKRLMGALATVSRAAVTYLASLGPVFSPSDSLSLDFIDTAAVICQENKAFLKHVLTHHFKRYLDDFIEIALTSPLDRGCMFLNAITAQFVPQMAQDSMLYSHDTFIRNITSATGKQLTKNEITYVYDVYLRIGKLILLGLVFLYHDDIKVRQDAMTLLAQPIPILLMIHTKCNAEEVKDVLEQVRANVLTLNTTIDSIRKANIVSLSRCLASHFTFCSEQFLDLVFKIVPAVSNTRRNCTRVEIIEIATPWLANLELDLARRVVLKNPSRFFFVFSPIVFLNDFTKCLSIMPNSFSTFHQWESLVSNAPGLEYIIIVLLEIARESEFGEYIAKAMTYVYRLNSAISMSTLIHYIDYASWYFQHIQLARFEEVEDMAKFVEKANRHSKLARCPTNSQIGSAVISQIHFVLKTLIKFTEEDITPVTDNIAAIGAFCLTHINDSMAMKLLAAIMRMFRNSSATDAPEFLTNACDLFDKITTIPYEELTFTVERTSSPLRALQDRQVSLSELSDIVRQMTEDEKSLCDHVIMWGLSCGDLQIASTALNIYGVISSETDKMVMLSLIENACFILRCLLDSDPDEATISSCTEYVNSILINITRMLKREISEGWEQASRLGILIITGEKPFFKLMVVHALNMLLVLHEAGFWRSIGTLVNLVHVYRHLLLTIYNDSAFVIRFTTALLSVNLESIQLIGIFSAFLPCLLVYGRDQTDQIVAIFIEKFENTGVVALSRVLKSMDSNTDFVMSICSALLRFDQVLVQAGWFYSRLFALEENRTPIRSAIYHIANCMLGVSQTHELYESLKYILQTATSKQSFETVDYCTELIATAFAGRVTAKELILERTDVSKISETRDIGTRESADFSSLQKYAGEGLHLLFKKGGVVNMDAQDRNSYPPLLPFQAAFFDLACFEEVASLCRNVVCMPFTQWSSILYRSRNITEILLSDTKPLDLVLDLPYASLMESIREQVTQENWDEEDESESSYSTDISTEQLSSQPTESDEQKLPDRMVSVAPVAFVPTFAEVATFVNSIFTDL